MNRSKLREQDKIDIKQLVNQTSSVKVNEIRSSLSVEVSRMTIDRFLKSDDLHRIASSAYLTQNSREENNVFKTLFSKNSLKLIFLGLNAFTGLAFLFEQPIRPID